VTAASCVVFGAGPLGLAVTSALRRRGDVVRVATRSGQAPVPAGVEVVAADATDPAAARRACEGAAVVYHCAATPYTTWPGTLPPIMKGIIQGAAAAGARLVYGDNLYGYGPVDRPLTEGLPDRATGPNGRVRAQLTETLLAAHRAGTVQATIGRASDFFGPRVRVSAMASGSSRPSCPAGPRRSCPTPTPRTPTRSSATSPPPCSPWATTTPRWARCGTSPAPRR
jgi:nucleoside-diphosphate-sugar epimerase